MSGGRSVAGSGGTDWSKFITLAEYGGVTDTTPVGSSRIIKQINGKGFISECVLYSSAMASSGNIKITIDGVVIVNKLLTNNSRLYGIINRKHVLFNNSTSGFYAPCFYQNYSNIASFSIENIANVFNTGTYGDLSCIMNFNPIFFNSSFILEFVSNNESSKGLCWSIQGGYQ